MLNLIVIDNGRPRTKRATAAMKSTVRESRASGLTLPIASWRLTTRQKRMSVQTYSIGRLDVTKDNVLLDEFSYQRNVAAPTQPHQALALHSSNWK